MNTRIVSMGVLALASASAFGGPLATLTLVDGVGGGGLPFNVTEFRLVNVSNDGSLITGTSLTIGDTSYLFDNVYEDYELFSGGNGTQAATLLVGSRDDNNVGTDVFEYGFGQFLPSVIFRGQFDIDQDVGAFQADARTVLFNNGDSPNAIWTVSFSDGTVASLTLQDGAVDGDSYTFTIPATSTAIGLLGGVVAMGSRRRR
jgi:hypothetical protein